MAGIYDEGLSYQGATTKPYNSASKATNAIGEGVTAGITTMNPWVAIGTTVLSIALQALTAPKQKRQWTGQDALLHDLKKRYTEIRERKEAAISIASAISGKPKESYMGLAGFTAVREPIPEHGGLSALDIYDKKQKMVKEKEIAKNPYTPQGTLTPEFVTLQEEKEQNKKIRGNPRFNSDNSVPIEENRKKRLY